MSGCNVAMPLENGGSAGTACGHWAENCLQSEVMTGYDSGANEISRITIAGLEDLKYSVDYSKADAFTNLNAACRCNTPSSLAAAAASNTNEADGDVDGGGDGEQAQLSDEGRAAAIAAGKDYLARRQTTAGEFGDGIGYLGDKMVSIVYMENDNIFSLLVRDTD